MKPVVSVIMLSYNTANYIKDAVASVLEQSFPDFELLVLDDGSTDHTEEVMAQFHDSRIRYIRSDQNRGIPFMRNRGLELARGKYLAILDSDDLAPPYRLKEQVEYMDQNLQTGVVAGDYFSFGARSFYCQTYKGNENIQYRFLFRCPIPNPAAMVRRSVVDRYGIRYDTSFQVCTDYKFWIELLGRTEFANLGGKPYLFYRRDHKESITTETKKADKIQLRDQAVNQIRRCFFERMGLELSEEDYWLFTRFYSYRQQSVTGQEFFRLTEVMEDLKVQGRKVLRCGSLWEEILDGWLEKACDIVLQRDL